MSLEYIEFDCVSICMNDDAVNGKGCYAEAVQAQHLDRHLSSRSCVCLSDEDDDKDVTNEGAASHESTPPGVTLQAANNIKSDNSNTDK